MPYLLYGQNSYAIRKKIEGLRRRFLQNDSSGINFCLLDGSKLDQNKFWSQVSSIPFLSEKRLIIILNLLLENDDDIFKKELSKNLSKIPNSSVVFFIENGVPDKRSALFKALNQKKFAQYFAPVTKEECSSFTDEKFSEFGIKIAPMIREKLLSSVSNDLFQVENEIIKLSLFAQAEGRKEITEKDIEVLTCVLNQADIFEFIDALGSRNIKAATLSLFNLLQTGQNELYLLSMIVYQFRTMLMISDLNSKKLTNHEISQKGKFHPFVVNKTLAGLKKISPDSLREIYDRIDQVDFNIKTGKIEPRLGLLLLIFNVCQRPVFLSKK